MSGANELLRLSHLLYFSLTSACLSELAGIALHLLRKVLGLKTSGKVTMGNDIVSKLIQERPNSVTVMVN